MCCLLGPLGTFSPTGDTNCDVPRHLTCDLSELRRVKVPLILPVVGGRGSTIFLGQIS